ncbi:MAG: restriction endonuclease subunit S [Desulfamplus sp.]|nr:restriction endonuclease subunit S [Desulfamplus sp.]
MLSEGWKYRRLEDVLTKIRKPVDVDENSFYREIGIRSHGKGIFHKDMVLGKSLGNKSVFWIEPNCLILNIVFAWEQAIAKTTDKESGFIASHRFPQFKPKDNLVDIDYLLFFFLTPKGKYLLNLASPGGAGRNKTLGQKGFENTKVLLPQFKEQQKIVHILSTWDKAIETVEKLIENSKQQKKALMQQLLTEKKRLSGLNEKWKTIHLNSLADHSKEHAFIDGDWVESLHITDSGIRLIQTGNIGVGHFINKNQKYISPKSYKVLKCKQVDIGDILICRLAEPAGRACIIPDINETKMITVVDVTILKIDNKKIINKFLIQYLNSSHYRLPEKSFYPALS